MKIKIEMEIKSVGNMGVGMGECVPNEAWLMKYAEAIAKEYSERVLSGKSKWPEEIEVVDLDDEDDEDEDEDDLVECDFCGELYPEDALNSDDLCEECAIQVEAEAEAEAELEQAEDELAEAQAKVDRARAKFASI